MAPPLVIGRSLLVFRIDMKSVCGMFLLTRHLIIERVCPLESPLPQVLSLMSLARLAMSSRVAAVLRPSWEVTALSPAPLVLANPVELNRKRIL